MPTLRRHVLTSVRIMTLVSAQKHGLDERRMLWSSDRSLSADHLVVLMHGAAGVPEDMVALFSSLPSGVVAVSLSGLVTVGRRRAWSDVTRADPDGLEASAGAVLAWLDGLSRWSSVGLVGYSQGGAVAVQLVRRAPRRFMYAVTLSAFLAVDEDDRDTHVAARRPPVFAGHGQLDDVIPAEAVTTLDSWLHRCTTATVRRYPQLGHDMSAVELADVRAFIGTQLSA